MWCVIDYWQWGERSVFGEEALCEKHFILLVENRFTGSIIETSVAEGDGLGEVMK